MAQTPNDMEMCCVEYTVGNFYCNTFHNSPSMQYWIWCCLDTIETVQNPHPTNTHVGTKIICSGLLEFRMTTKLSEHYNK